jgi:hypothetical protein
MTALEIAKAIMTDISDRRGLGDELDAVDDDVKEEILTAWAAIISEGFSDTSPGNQE